MKVKIVQWNAVASWVWDLETDNQQCSICQVPFESTCPRCKIPGDDCPPGIIIIYYSKSRDNVLIIFTSIVLLNGLEQNLILFVLTVGHLGPKNVFDSSNSLNIYYFYNLINSV